METHLTIQKVSSVHLLFSLQVFTSHNIFNISFAQDKAPLQVMEEHSESTDDKGKGTIIVSYRERIALRILIVHSQTH